MHSRSNIDPYQRPDCKKDIEYLFPLDSDKLYHRPAVLHKERSGRKELLVVQLVH